MTTTTPAQCQPAHRVRHCVDAQSTAVSASVCIAWGRYEVPADRWGLTTWQNDGRQKSPAHLTICCYRASPKGDPTAANTAGLFHDLGREIARLIVVVPPSGPLFAVLAAEVSTSASHGAILNGCCFAEEADINASLDHVLSQIASIAGLPVADMGHAELEWDMHGSRETACHRAAAAAKASASASKSQIQARSWCWADSARSRSAPDA